MKRFKPDSESSQSEEGEKIQWDKWIGGFAFDYEKYHINEKCHINRNCKTNDRNENSNMKNI